MRAIVFRVLAGLLAVAFATLPAYGDLSKLSLREKIGIGAIAAGFALYSLTGSDLGERLIRIVFGGRDPNAGSKPPADNHTEPGAKPE